MCIRDRAKDVANGKAAADDFATAIYSQLLSLQESREPVEVVTSRRRSVSYTHLCSRLMKPSLPTRKK